MPDPNQVEWRSEQIAQVLLEVNNRVQIIILFLCLQLS